MSGEANVGQASRLPRQRHSATGNATKELEADIAADKWSGSGKFALYMPVELGLLSSMPTTAPKSRAPASVDARQATQSALNYFRTLFPDKLLQVSDPTLEEIEMSKDGKFWLVTLGFNETRPKNENLPKFLQVPLRKLKIFKVDAATGQVLSMKIPKDE